MSAKPAGKRRKTHDGQPQALRLSPVSAGDAGRLGHGNYRGARRIRKDVAVTLFLCDPASYDGGELIIETGWSEQAIKLPLNHAVLYPADRLHRVAKVTRGTRLVAVTWLESHVPDAGQREIVADMLTVARHLHATQPEAQATDLAFKCWGNLVRRWAGT